jgi:hypothetical protein
MDFFYENKIDGVGLGNDTWKHRRCEKIPQGAGAATNLILFGAEQLP